MTNVDRRRQRRCLLVTVEHSSKTLTYVLFGSPNASRKALLLTPSQRGNVETALVFVLEGEHVLRDFAEPLVYCPLPALSLRERPFPAVEAAAVALVEAADLSALASFPCNDMVVDASGRAYIGNFGFDIFARPVVPKPTVLAMVTPDGAVSIAANEVLFPNGAVITPDGRTMILAETFGRRLTAYDIASDGTLANRRLWADLDNIAPDGICLDAEGAVWVASPRSNEFVRVLQGGRLAQRIASPQQGIACALGGADGRTLFLVSGRVRSRADSLADRGGRIDAIRVEVPAAAPPGII